MKLLQLLFSLRGRISRGQFWLGKLLSIIIFGGLLGVFALAESVFPVANLSANVMDSLIWILLLPLIGYEFSSIALELKRWHDLGRSMLIMLVVHAFPIVGSIFASLVVGFLEGDPGPNQYGPDPLGREALREWPDEVDF
ncbi:MAG TPA: DUF805 domain-containing protein [Caulifigura sp.]|nr:DUF805 domain-containing protein [Caulifigura sp.]